MATSLLWGNRRIQRRVPKRVQSCVRYLAVVILTCVSAGCIKAEYHFGSDEARRVVGALAAARETKGRSAAPKGQEQTIRLKYSDRVKVEFRRSSATELDELVTIRSLAGDVDEIEGLTYQYENWGPLLISVGAGIFAQNLIFPIVMAVRNDDPLEAMPLFGPSRNAILSLVRMIDQCRSESGKECMVDILRYGGLAALGVSTVVSQLYGLGMIAYGVAIFEPSREMSSNDSPSPIVNLSVSPLGYGGFGPVLNVVF